MHYDAQNGNRPGVGSQARCCSQPAGWYITPTAYGPTDRPVAWGDSLQQATVWANLRAFLDKNVIIYDYDLYSA